MLDFNDTKTAYTLKTDKQLQKAHWLFKLVESSFLVKLGSWGSNLALKLRLPIKGLVKKTVYDQFVGGENIQECEPVIEKLESEKVNALLDYAVEGKESLEEFEKTKKEIINTIIYGAKRNGVRFAVFKVTGVARFALLEKRSAKKDWDEQDEEEWQEALLRVTDICEAANKYGFRLMIDAEETWIQDAIDEMAYLMMSRFNKKQLVVLNTLQMYRVDRLDFLHKAFKRSQEEGFKYGVKLVRGAYMEKERARAKAKGYPDPIHPNKDASDKSYDDAVAFCVENLEHIAFVAGSHNEESSAKLAKLLMDKGLERNHPNVWFSQLYGMSDHLSFNLAKEGFNVVKYLPFGPVEETLPYLIRRAEENTSAGGQSSRELSLIEKEMARRGLK